LLFCHFEQGPHNEVEAAERGQQQIINQQHQLAPPLSSFSRMFTKL
jgi:hypothetical protein